MGQYLSNNNSYLHKDNRALASFCGTKFSSTIKTHARLTCHFFISIHTNRNFRRQQLKNSTDAKCYLVFAVIPVAGDGGGDGGSGGEDAGGGGLNARRYELEGRRNKSIAALAAATVVLALILHNNKQRSDFPPATGESPGIPSTRVAERSRSNIA